MSLWSWDIAAGTLSVPALRLTVYADSYDDALAQLCAILGVK